MKTRLDQFDVLRGGAILLVILAHWINFYQLYNIRITNELAFFLKPFLLIVSLLYPVRMALLFFISGYFCKIKNNFFEKKISRIVYPYVIWSIILFFLNAPNPFNHKIYWQYTLPLFFGFSPLVWYLYFLFVFYLLTYFIKNKVFLVIFSFIFVLSAPFVDSIIPQKFRTSFISIVDVSYYLLYFLSGYLFKILWSNIINLTIINKTLLLIVSFSFLITGIVFISRPTSVRFESFFAIIIVISSLILITTLWKNAKDNNKFLHCSYALLCYIGNNSMRFYILHYFILNSIFILGLNKLTIFNQFFCLCYIFIFIPLSIKYGSDILFNFKFQVNNSSK